MQAFCNPGSDFNRENNVEESYWFELALKLFNNVPAKVIDIWSNGLVVKALDYQSRGPVFKTTGGSKVGSAFRPSKVDKMSTRKFWELNGKK